MDHGSIRAIEAIIDAAHRAGRSRLREHEAYEIVRRAGAADPPAHVFVPRGEAPAPEAPTRIESRRVALKLVSPDVVHKSDAGGVAFCRNDLTEITREIARMTDRPERVDGVLIVEFVDRAHAGLGAELFVGIRATREFGPVIGAGLGGTDTEYLAASLRPDRAVASALASDISPEEFFRLVTRTSAYELVSGRVRGHERTVSDDALRRCFAAFIELANRYCTPRDHGLSITELEVNPFACAGERLIPLDGRCRLGRPARGAPPRPAPGVRALLEPQSIGVLGVSATNPRSFGRIILRNVTNAGFDPSAVCAIKPDTDRIDGVRCVPSISALGHPVDLLVVAAGASELPAIVNECVDSGMVRSAILIPGGAGETEGSEGIARALHDAVARARRSEDGPVFLGPNCMGVQSRPGRYDTIFIPEEKLAKRWDAPHRGVAIVSQSGAFIVRTLSRFESLDPAFALSIGNQCDLTISDLVRAVADRADIHTIGVYVEGFTDGDGLITIRAIGDATRAGKATVFYKGGRTPAGRDAAAGHTASLAGDSDVCAAGAAQAGALVADDFESFSQLLELATLTHGARGARIGAVTNAGCESVAMGDSAGEAPDAPKLPPVGAATRARLAEALGAHRLATLVSPRNPVDLTPMATDAAYLDVARVMLEADEFDALIVSCIPATPAIVSVETELVSGSPLAEGLRRLRDEHTKPIVAVVDAGPRYEPFVEALRAAGVPVMRSADDAARALGRVLAQRSRGPSPAESPDPVLTRV